MAWPDYEPTTAKKKEMVEVRAGGSDDVFDLDANEKAMTSDIINKRKEKESKKIEKTLGEMGMEEFNDVFGYKTPSPEIKKVLTPKEEEEALMRALTAGKILPSELPF